MFGGGDAGAPRSSDAVDRPAGCSSVKRLPTDDPAKTRPRVPAVVAPSTVDGRPLDPYSPVR
ncbi:hypothetical protein K933_16837 [Candidatus Halobonum tyrrellensis G22]|uniref:Uncharacterized protein n=1 Tax=Candidatus Halobonum tyrrellensis G22 TaxID=1324957 RepID=V4GNI0_9EURY|nr:hypothetical protein K933_16837 [Candidatus Halobonum tyrrellensis G22]